MVWSALLSLILVGGELPDGARLSARFEPSRVKPGEKATLELSVTPPSGSVLLAFMQPKSLGAPTALQLEPGPLALVGPLEEPAVKERPEPALQAEKVRYYPQSFGGTVVIKLPMSAPAAFTDGRAELRGTVTLLFVDEKSRKLTLIPAVPIVGTLEEDKPETSPLLPAAALDPPPPIIFDAPPKQKPEPSTVTSLETPATVDLASPPTKSNSPATTPAKATQGWFILGALAGLLALAAGPVGAYDERRWWARWLGWRRLQAWSAALTGILLVAAALLLPTRTAIPVLVGVAAFGGMLFATGGPGASGNIVSAALRAQPLHGLLLCVALLVGGVCYDASAGFAAAFLMRSCAPAVVPSDADDFDDESDDEEEPPRRRKRLKSHR